MLVIQILFLIVTSILLYIITIPTLFPKEKNTLVVKEDTENLEPLAYFCREHFICHETSIFKPVFSSNYFSNKSFFYLYDIKEDQILGVLVYYEIFHPINYLFISMLCIHRQYRKMGYAKLLIGALQKSNLVAKKPAIFCLDQYTYAHKLPTLPSPCFLLAQKEVIWTYVDATWIKSHHVHMKCRFSSFIQSNVTLQGARQHNAVIYFQRLPLSYQEIQNVYSLEYAVSSEKECTFDPSSFLQIPCIIIIQKDDLLTEAAFLMKTFSKENVYLHDPGETFSSSRKNEILMDSLFLPS
jgi:hypothetical protein